jgi:hypothetical protein
MSFYNDLLFEIYHYIPRFHIPLLNKVCKRLKIINGQRACARLVDCFSKQSYVSNDTFIAKDMIMCIKDYMKHVKLVI